MFPNPRSAFGMFIAVLQAAFNAVSGLVQASRYGQGDALASDSSKAEGFSPIAFTPTANTRLRVMFFGVTPLVTVSDGATLVFLVYNDAGVSDAGAPVAIPPGLYATNKWYLLPLTPGVVPVVNPIKPGTSVSVNAIKTGAGVLLRQYLVQIVLQGVKVSLRKGASPHNTLASSTCGGLLSGDSDPCSDDPPRALTKAEFQAYAERCGRDIAIDKMVEESGIPREFIEDAADGKITWQSVTEAYAVTQGVTFDAEGLVDENGDIDWRVAAKDAGSLAAYAACSAFPATAPVASLCSYGGYVAGGYLYDLGSEAYQGWKSVLWGPEETPKEYNVDGLRSEVGSLIARFYLSNGESDYLFNQAMLQGVVSQYYWMVRRLEAIRAKKGLAFVPGEELLSKQGHPGPPPGGKFLVSTGFNPLNGSCRKAYDPNQPGGTVTLEADGTMSVGTTCPSWNDTWSTLGIDKNSLPLNFFEHELFTYLSRPEDTAKLVYPMEPDFFKLYANREEFLYEHTNFSFKVTCANKPGQWAGEPKPQGLLFDAYDGTVPPQATLVRQSNCKLNGYSPGAVKFHASSVLFNPQVRSFCNQSRNSAIAGKNLMLDILQITSNRALFAALKEPAPLVFTKVPGQGIVYADGTTPNWGALIAARSAVKDEKSLLSKTLPFVPGLALALVAGVHIWQAKKAGKSVFTVFQKNEKNV